MRFLLASSVSCRAVFISPRRGTHTDQRRTILQAALKYTRLGRNPVTGIVGCCVRAVSGQAAMPPSSVMKSRADAVEADIAQRIKAPIRSFALTSHYVPWKLRPA